VRCALFVLLLLRGTPTLYAGDEIGLDDVEMPSSRWRDEGSGPGGRSRDPGRTPIPWERGPGHGFTQPGVEPWLPIGGVARSVAEQRADPDSTLAWCQKVIALRRRIPDLASGTQELLDGDDDVLAWKRGDVLTVAANLSPTATAMPGRLGGDLLLASDGVRLARDDAAIELPPWGCAVVGG
jgi:alpha-glucosidase